MPIFFNANYKGVAMLGGTFGLSRPIVNAAIKYGMFAVAEYWHKRILPLHFTRLARRKYKHQPRKRNYTDIKRKLAQGLGVPDPVTGIMQFANVVKGGLVDIAFEGATEDKSKATRAIRVTLSGFSLKFYVPRYILGRKRGDFPNMKRELSYITTEEAMFLGRVWWRAAYQFLRANLISHTVAAGP